MRIDNFLDRRYVDVREYRAMRGTATDRIRHILQDEIAKGMLPPGQALDEAALSKRFQVSRTPVREALLQLAIQGFVRVVPRSGIFVTTLDLRALTDMSETLAHLDGLCAGLACQRMRPTERRRLAAMQQNCQQAFDEHDTARYIELNEAFHSFIYQSCGNPFLQQQAQFIRLHTQPYRSRYMSAQPEQVAQSHQEHGDLVTAILENDAQQAAEIATLHVLNAVRQLGILAEHKPELLWEQMDRMKRNKTQAPMPQHANLNWIFAGKPIGSPLA
jgi:DNA-binding GntR family transcriptional regulator